ncbi:MAG: hypothetical protein JWP01_3027 [Myxococcales bacterium]|nr:hypothetical protein [Myxococcales bacterium]
MVSPLVTWLRKPVVLAILAGVIAAVVFSPSFSGGWIYDDHTLIAKNAFIRSGAHWPRWFVTDFWNVYGDAEPSAPRLVYWRPLVTATYAFDWHSGGGSSWVFHLTNLLLHAAVGALAFVALRRWIDATGPAFAAAVLFAVHPTKAESVAWISGRTDVLCMLAVLVATQGMARRLRGQRGGLALEVFGTIAAYTCKEQAIVLPVFLAVEAWVYAGRPAIDRSVVVRMIRSALPQAVVAIGYLTLRRFALPLRSANFEGGIGFTAHVQSVLESFGRFVSLTFAPHDLSTQQGLVRMSGGDIAHSMPYVVLGVLALTVLIGAAVVAHRRLTFVTIGFGFFLITLLPTSNIVYTHLDTLVSERFLYLPMFGMAFAAGCALARWPRRSAYALVVAVALAMAALGAKRSADFVDERRFWAHELELHPESPTARRSVINTAVEEKRYRQAVVLLLELTRNRVSYQDVAVAFQLAQLISDLTPDHDRAGLETLDAFCKDLLTSKQPAATLAIGNIQFTIPTDTKLFEKHLRNYHLRLTLHRASLRSRLGDDTGAVALASEAVRECPTCTNVLSVGILVFARAGMYDDAMALLESPGGHASDALLDKLRAQIEKARSARERSLQLQGPAQIQASVAELTALELWGRAYDLLAPYKTEIKQSPKSTALFAELAFRAGEQAVAREALAGTLSPAEIEERIAAWAYTMGWAE